MQQRNRLIIKNFELPLDLGLKNLCDDYEEEYEYENELEIDSNSEYPRFLDTDLQNVKLWDGFDDWVGNKLSLIDDNVWDNFLMPDLSLSEAGYNFVVQEKEDLHRFLEDYLFFFTSKLMTIIDKCFEEYGFFYNSTHSYDFEFKKSNDGVLMVVDAELYHDWPELGCEDLNCDVSKRHFERMYAYMVLNQVEYGILTNYRSTRFVMLKDNSLSVSDPFWFNEQEKHTMIGALVAMILHVSDYKVVTPESSISERDLEFPVNSYNREYKYGDVIIKDGRYSLRDELYIARGVYKRQQGDFNSSCLLKYQDVSKCQFDKLQWEAEIYKRLDYLQGEIIPECYNYGLIWDAYSILVIQNPGKRLKRKDFDKIPNIRYKIMSAVKILHSNNIIHGTIRPSSFFVDKHGDVLIGKLSRCQVSGANFKKLDEIERVRRMFITCSSKASIHWRENKKQRAKQLWKRYKKDYIRMHTINGMMVARKLACS